MIKNAVLITELPTILDTSIEESMNESIGQMERNYYVHGIFSTPGVKNRNGRTYSKEIWVDNVNKYQNEINEKTLNSLGEKEHPERTYVDPLEAVVRIVELEIREDGNVWGKAKILNDNTDKTNKLKSLIREGIQIGVSSRGVGTLNEKTGIVETFKLITYDIVDLPSDYNAMLDGYITENVKGVKFLNGIVKDKVYTLDKNGCIGDSCNIIKESKEEDIETIKNECKAKIDELEKKIEFNEKKIVESLSNYINNIIKESKEEDIETIKNECRAKIEFNEKKIVESLTNYINNNINIIKENKSNIFKDLSDKLKYKYK